jgi:hypothetical protein
LATLKLSERLLPRDVTTRWNSTFEMLDFAFTHRKALDLMTQDRENGLREYELNEEEWEIVRQLRDALKVSTGQSRNRDSVSVLTLMPFQIFKDATLFFSRDTPNLAVVIPAMDHIDQHLATASLNRTYSPTVRVALAMGKSTLNKYYNLTDASELYRIAMGNDPINFTWFAMLTRLSTVLHPRHKLQYFRHAEWPQEWIDTARDIVRSVFERSYVPKPAAGDEQAQTTVKQTVSTRRLRPQLNVP